MFTEVRDFIPGCLVTFGHRVSKRPVVFPVVRLAQLVQLQVVKQAHIHPLFFLLFFSSSLGNCYPVSLLGSLSVFSGFKPWIYICCIARLIASLIARHPVTGMPGSTFFTERTRYWHASQSGSSIEQAFGALEPGAAEPVAEAASTAGVFATALRLLPRLLSTVDFSTCVAPIERR